MELMKTLKLFGNEYEVCDAEAREGSVMVATIGPGEAGLECDKTFEELDAHYKSGRAIIFDFNGTRYMQNIGDTDYSSGELEYTSYGFMSYSLNTDASKTIAGFGAVVKNSGVVEFRSHSLDLDATYVQKTDYKPIQMVTFTKGSDETITCDKDLDTLINLLKNGYYVVANYNKTFYQCGSYTDNAVWFYCMKGQHNWELSYIKDVMTSVITITHTITNVSE